MVSMRFKLYCFSISKLLQADRMTTFNFKYTENKLQHNINVVIAQN